MARTDPAAAVILHRTRLGKGSMEKFGIDYQWRSEHFFTVIFHLSIGKANFPKEKPFAPLEIAQRVSHRD
jgi:hypothetical protein